MDRESILHLLHTQINASGHIIGAAVGSGMTAKYTVAGGADFLLALSAGKYRIMGRSSYASYFCYGNSNEMVMDLGLKEILPIIKNVPVLFGLFASDPEVSLYDYLKVIKENGFSGIVNFPTMALIDGNFRLALEEDSNTYAREAEAIRLAHYLDMFTVAFVTSEEEARQMLAAEADVICVHLGLTKGGILGAKHSLPIFDAMKMTERIYEICEKTNPYVLRMIYAGPASTPIDMQYIYQNTICQGYIGGSTFERIPAENAIYNTTKAFKSYGDFNRNDPRNKLIEGTLMSGDYIEFVKQYIADNYMKEIRLSDLAMLVHVSGTYLSTRFKKEMNISFTEYLLDYRLNKAKEFLQKTNADCKNVAEAVGYYDYAQFSKIFKKKIGVNPSEYRKSINAGNSENSETMNS